MSTVTMPRRAAGRWPLPIAALILAIAALLMLFARDVADMTAQWWHSSTYQHCLFVLPIVGWLVWQRRHEVAPVPPMGWPPGLLLVLGGAVLWLLGEAGGVALVRHVGLVAMMQASIVTIVGPAVTRACLFPIFYLIFLVPFGDEVVGPMQTLTARLTMTLLALTGVPATIDGVFITTRAGWFEVAEACAGVKFLIAMVAFGALAAHVCFISPVRRAVFMAVAIVVPVLANGVRAWGTIVAAERISLTFATGFDHIVYGWFFFAGITVLVMSVAWRFFDRPAGSAWLSGRNFTAWQPVAPAWLMTPLVLVIAAIGPLWATVGSHVGRSALPHAVALPLVAGWTRTDDLPVAPWVARFDGADHRLTGRYRDAAGHAVDVAVALYGWQDRGREIVAFGQGAADPRGPWQWAADLPSISGGHAERLLGSGARPRVAVTFWMVGGQPVATRAGVKAITLIQRLTARDQSAGVMIVSAEGTSGSAVVQAFITALRSPAARLVALRDQAHGV